VQYHFVSREDFVSLLDQGGFVEHAEFSGNLYGTSKRAIDSIVESGKRCILDIEVQVFFLVVPTRDIPFMFTVGRPSS
jgi:guanylate kinase